MPLNMHREPEAHSKEAAAVTWRAGSDAAPLAAGATALLATIMLALSMAFLMFSGAGCAGGETGDTGSTVVSEVTAENSTVTNNETTAQSGTNDTSNTTSTEKMPTGNVDGQVGKTLVLGEVRITVNALAATLRPAMPAQRVSEQPPPAPAAGDSFYQAYVRVENTGVMPVRVDPADFACAIGDQVVSVDLTRSGPVARSLLKNASLDLLLTFKGPAGFEPELLYAPAWYDGIIRIKAQEPSQQETPSTTG
ncbi:MAG: hypothetical protein H5T84_08830 [Thermoleophilia bacterium]|nr:hypothetical protein [Thermoleophilia bacterium]